MEQENPFRWSMIAMVVLISAVTLYFRLQAARSDEKISRRDEGIAFAITLRLAGLSLWIATFTYLLFPTATPWAKLPLPTPVRWFGVVVGFACSCLMYWTLSNLGRNLTDTVVTRREATLVTHGPYRWVRHPFYVTAALLMAATTVASANALIGLASVLVMGLLAVRTPREEARLVARFGPSYENYMATTGRFFPRLDLFLRHSHRD
jgi:protein-S-isoprenylcysteine O-methyltransferase Ste14